MKEFPPRKVYRLHLEKATYLIIEDEGAYLCLHWIERDVQIYSILRKARIYEPTNTLVISHWGLRMVDKEPLQEIYEDIAGLPYWKITKYVCDLFAFGGGGHVHDCISGRIVNKELSKKIIDALDYKFIDSLYPSPIYKAMNVVGNSSVN